MNKGKRNVVWVRAPPAAAEAARHCWEGAGGAVYGSAVKQLARAGGRCRPWEVSGHEREWPEQGSGAAAVAAQGQSGQPKAQPRLQKAGECLRFVGWVAGMLSLRRQDSAWAAGTPGPGGGCLRGCQKTFGEAAAGPGERPGQNRHGKAEEWVACCACWLSLFLSFVCLVASVSSHTHRERADEWP